MQNWKNKLTEYGTELKTKAKQSERLALVEATRSKEKSDTVSESVNANQSVNTTPPQQEEKILIEGHMAIIFNQWKQTHSPEEKAPIIQDPVTKELTWVNRKARRHADQQYRASRTQFSAILTRYTKQLRKEKNRTKAQFQKASRKVNRQAA